MNVSGVVLPSAESYKVQACNMKLYGNSCHSGLRISVTVYAWKWSCTTIEIRPSNNEIGCMCIYIMSKCRSSTANSGTKVAVILGINRYGSFPLLSAPHFLFSIWADLKRSEKIPGTPAWRWGEWIWLTGPSGLHRNSPQGLNISSIRVSNQIRDPEIQITLRPPPIYSRGLKFFQVIYESFDCYLTHGFFIRCFSK